MTVFRVEVREKGSAAAAFEVPGPNPTVPRVGEYVELGEGVGRVSEVTWLPADSLIVVECAQVRGRRALRD